MTTSLLEAFDLVAHSEQLERRLDAAAGELAKQPGLAEEKAWLDVGRSRVAEARNGIGDLVTRVLRLPELDSVREPHSRSLQGAVVDALDRLHAGISFAGGGRSPLLEALYWKLKTPPLRKCDRKEFDVFWSDFQTRLASSYVRRMLATPDYAVVVPAVDELHRAVETWFGIFTTGPLDEAEAEPLRQELEDAALRLEIPCRQGRLLAQAALAPLKELLDGSGLVPKRARRGARGLADEEDTHALLEQDPPDPSEPTWEEQRELDRAHAASERAETPPAPSELVMSPPDIEEDVEPAEETTPPVEETERGRRPRRARSS